MGNREACRKCGWTGLVVRGLCVNAGICEYDAAPERQAALKSAAAELAAEGKRTAYLWQSV